MRFRNWPVLEFKEGSLGEMTDFRQQYQMELVTIVFLLSLKAVQCHIQASKIQIDLNSAQQLAVDIKYIIESILGSKIL